MLGSKQLLRTNPALTANFKLVVNADYKLYLESYDSNANLSDQKYKHFSVNDTSYLTERVPSFFRGLPKDLVFEVRKHTPSDTVQSDFGLQMDDMYWSGGAPIEDRWHQEECEYHAPLYVDPKQLPKRFIVLRVDGPGDCNLRATADASVPARRQRLFSDEVAKRWKCVTMFDLTKTSALGRFLDKNFASNEYFPAEPFSLNLRKHQFSSWNGYDVAVGGYGVKSAFLHATMEEEATHFELEDFVTAGFRKNGVAVPHVLNMKFLFDDTPGTINRSGTARRKWSINRYMGFYLDDLTAVRRVSPYLPVALRPDVLLADNVFIAGYDNAGTPLYTDPTENGWPLNEASLYVKRGDDFLQVQRVTLPTANIRTGISLLNNLFITIDTATGLTVYVDPTEKGWPADASEMYVKRGLSFYVVKRVVTPATLTAPQTVKYQLIDTAVNNGDAGALGFQTAIQEYYKYVVIDRALNNGSAGSLLPSTPVSVTYQEAPIAQSMTTPQFINGKIVIKNADNTALSIPGYREDGLYLIEVGGQYYTLVRDETDNFCINSDTHMQTTASQLLRELAGDTLPPLDFLQADNVGPLYFTIYQAQFTEVADFDFDRVDTGYSRYEYEQATELKPTDEPKLWAQDYRTAVDDVYAEEGYAVVAPADPAPRAMPPFYVPASSEYAAGGDLWLTQPDGGLGALWSKNPGVNKWGVFGSVSHANYAYKLNNSTTVGGKFNRAPSHLDVRPDRRSCNLDWFYTVGAPRRENASADVTSPLRWTLASEHLSFRSLEVDALPPGPAPVGNFWTYQQFDLAAYADPKLPFDYFEWFLTQQQQLDSSPLHVVRHNAQRYANFSSSDGVNGPVGLFRGLCAELRWASPADPARTAADRTEPAVGAAGYKFSAVLTKRPTLDAGLHGQAGITVYVNKVYGNVLVAVWVYTPFNSKTNFESVYRDSLYKAPKLQYDCNTTQPKLARVGPEQLTLLNVVNAINIPEQAWGFSQPAEFVVIDNVPSYKIEAVTTSNTELVVHVNGAAAYKQGEFIALPALDGTSEAIVSRISKVTLGADSAEIVVETGVSQAGVDYSVLGASKARLAKAPNRRPFVLALRAPDAVQVHRSPYEIRPVEVDIKPRNTVRALAPGFALVKSASESLLQSPYAGQPASRVRVNVGAFGPHTTIYRFSGAYAPVLKPLPLFAPMTLPFGETYKMADAPDPLVQPLLGAGNTASGSLTLPVIGHTPAVGDIVCLSTDAAQQNVYTNYKLCRVAAIQVMTASDATLVPRVVLDYKVSAGNVGTPVVSYLSHNKPRLFFDTTLHDFGTMRELMASKTSPAQVLQTSKSGSKYRSVYPMLDEHGMTVMPRFVFKSTWDDEHYAQTVPYDMNRYAPGIQEADWSSTSRFRSGT